MGPDTIVSVLGASLLVFGALLARLPIGTCTQCPHCNAERLAKEREAEAQIGRFYGIPICRACGRYHTREEDHRF
jgi:DNA-directed RNA polymerase subunit RPC12/RpoP